MGLYEEFISRVQEFIMQKQITQFLIFFKKIMFFHCAFKLISIKLQLGYFD